jgi:2-deoxy-D-gluconate 3-dehydrogenase
VTISDATPLSQLLDLSGQVAIVTGGAVGIGRAIAQRLAEAGAAVIIADLDEAAARETAGNIAAGGGRADALRVDVASPDATREMVARTVETFGRLNILVNNAGIYPFAAARDVSEPHWDRVLDVNLKGAFFAAQAAAERMIAQGHGGRIVNIASVDALRPTGNLAPYDASKAGLVMLTRALALEYAPHGILVNAILPGEVVTPGAEKAGEALKAAGQEGQAGEEPERGVGVAEMSSAAFLARIPLRRLGRPDDVACVALFLASGLADYLTGSAIVVDGGYLLT